MIKIKRKDGSNNLEKEQKKNTAEWWTEEHGLFGSFYLECEKVVHNFKSRTYKEAEGVISLLQLKAGMKLFDCPCGYGRHSNYLAAKGIDVIGGDINNTFLNLAISEAKEMKVSTSFEKVDMLNINYITEFDAVINMFVSFGYFDTDEDNVQTLRNFYDALKPGGKFLMHTDATVPPLIMNNYEFEEVFALTSGNELHQSVKYDPVTKRINDTWKIVQPDGLSEEMDLSIRLYTKEEFIEMCFRVGFREVEVYSDWNGAKYSIASKNMIVVALK